MTHIRKESYLPIALFVILLLTCVSIGLGILYIGAKVNQNTANLAERNQLSAERAYIIQQAIMATCQETNKKFGKVIPIEKASLKDITSGHFEYYKTHPAERAFAIDQINKAIRVLEPTSCTVKITGTKPHQTIGATTTTPVSGSP